MLSIETFSWYIIIHTEMADAIPLMDVMGAQLYPSNKYLIIQLSYSSKAKTVFPNLFEFVIVTFANCGIPVVNTQAAHRHVQLRSLSLTHFPINITLTVLYQCGLLMQWTRCGQ